MTRTAASRCSLLLALLALGGCHDSPTENVAQPAGPGISNIIGPVSVSAIGGDGVVLTLTATATRVQYNSGSTVMDADWSPKTLADGTTTTVGFPEVTFSTRCRLPCSRRSRDTARMAQFPTILCIV